MNFLTKFKRLKKFLDKTQIQPASIVIPVFLSLTAALLEGAMTTLLIPLAKGIIQMDFSFVKETAIFKIMEGFFKPFVFSNQTIFIILVGSIFILAVTKNILRYAASLGVMFQVRKLSNNLRQLVFARYLSFGKQFFDRNSQGYLNNIITGFISLIAQNLMLLHTALSHSFMLIIYVILMFLISWKLTLVTLFIFPLSYYTLEWLIKKIKKTSQSYANAEGDLNKYLYNMLSCLFLIKVYRQENNEKKKFSSISSSVSRFEFSIDKKYHLIDPVQEIILLIAIIVLISAAAFLLIKKHSGEISTFLVYFYILKRSSVFIGGLSGFKGAMAQISGPFSKIAEILNDKDKFFVTSGEKKFEGLKEDVEFRNLNFSYIPERPVLKGLNFRIEKNKLTAIVGPTGAGKTTIINLLLRLYDCPPQSIFIDGIQIREFSLESLMGHMAVVSQDILLFNDTLRANITYGIDREISEAELIEVVKKARLYDFVMQLPAKFDTLIGDRGVKLSGGEKQRVAISRVLLKGAEILILDEATSSLDTHTERLIQEGINEAIKGKTTIVIAHRLSTIKNADKIVVIDEGRLMEEGVLEELLARQGKFYQYWTEQKFF